MARTGFYSHPSFLLHDSGPLHPERAARVRSICERIQQCGLASDLAQREAPCAAVEEIAALHDPAYVRAVEAACRAGGAQLDPDTRVSRGSWEAALRAAGGALAAVDAVMRGEIDHAFVAARPPGHHAERGASMGFCLFGNAALAARRLRAFHRLERVAIVDWDVHHGNGTQHLFEEDPTVFYASLHQYPLWPGTGRRDERGRGAGAGATLNCPQPPGAGDDEWLGAFEREVLPALEQFRPEFVVVSAGFDAHRDDPLAQTELSTPAYARMTEWLADLCRRRCRGRLVALLEGGYDLKALADSVEVHLQSLLAAKTA